MLSRRLLIAPLVLLATPASAQFNSAIQASRCCWCPSCSCQRPRARSSTAPSRAPSPTPRRACSPAPRSGHQHHHRSGGETTTSADGVYTASASAVGTYRVEVELDGFLKAHARGHGRDQRNRARLDFALEVSGVPGERDRRRRPRRWSKPAGPRVRARRSHAAAGDAAQRPEPLQPDRAAAGRDRQGRVVHLRRGGNGNDSFSGESAPRINASGQRDEANSFTLDDTSTNGVARGGITNLTPNSESVEEMRVVANNFSAVDGRNSGAQIQVISKGGTNSSAAARRSTTRTRTSRPRTCSRPPCPSSRRSSSATASAGRS